MKIKSGMAIAVVLTIINTWVIQLNAAGQVTGDKSPITEPYRYVNEGGYEGRKVPLSPDPLVSYRWPNPQAGNELEIYLLKPETISTEAPASFGNLESLKEKSPNVEVRGIGSIRLDFGRESAAWLEFDSPDLSDSVEMSISEYNQPARAGIVPGRETKTLCPTKYRNTYRLELNKELYEGVRFGWIHVRSFSKNWHITGVRLVCQIRPTNYNGSFSCSDTLLTRIWYAGAYTVKLNLLKDYFGAILMYRGDRYSWTGDAHPAQAASMVAFGNYDVVKKNIDFTARESNGIRSYALYWVLSLIDYFNYTGDSATLNAYAVNAMEKLDDAYKLYGTNPNLEYFGWDERLGAGFEHPNIPEPQRAYKMLSIRAWKLFGDAMASCGRTDLQSQYSRYADEKIKAWRENAGWYIDFGLHAGADAINTGLLNSAEKSAIYHNSLSDRLNRISYSPFNQYFVIQALSLVNQYDDAFSSIRDLWGGELKYGGTSFFEDYRPSWNSLVGENDPIPNNQCGFVSLCHPWGAGVTKWLSEEVLGIKPTSPGFGTYDILPHLGRTLTRVSGDIPTLKGKIAAGFDVSTGVGSVTSPAGTIGRIGIPKAYKNIASITINGAVVWNGVFHPVAGIGGASEDALFVYFSGVQPGSYKFLTKYKGTTPAYKEQDWSYPARYVGIDSVTSGNWGGVYGKDGYTLCNYYGSSKDKQSLPSYVSSIDYYKVKGNGKPLDLVWEPNTNDRRALASDMTNSVPRTAACLNAIDPDQIAYTFTFTANVKDTHKYKISLYFLDWDNKGRKIAVEMFDANTLNLVAPVRIVRDCVGGAYLTYAYDKSVKFRIDMVRGSNAVLSGIFFDPENE
jgi:alpha-L-rhamnosidase